jgi:tetratricopeptide (TPR) repeat protein
MNERSIARRIDEAVGRFQGGDLVEAGRIIDQVLGKQPRHAGALHLRGLIHAVQGETLRAVTLFEKALARDDRNIELLANLAKGLSDLGRFADALITYEKALKLTGRGPYAANNRGLALAELDRADDAIASYERALALAPDYADAWSNRGLSLCMLRR